MSSAVMMERIAEASPRFKARIAGVFYLLVILTALFAQISRDRLIVPDDAAATATNILAHGTLLRLGFASDLIATSAQPLEVRSRSDDWAGSHRVRDVRTLRLVNDRRVGSERGGDGRERRQLVIVDHYGLGRVHGPGLGVGHDLADLLGCVGLG